MSPSLDRSSVQQKPTLSEGRKEGLCDHHGHRAGLLPKRGQCASVRGVRGNLNTSPLTDEFPERQESLI